MSEPGLRNDLPFLVSAFQRRRDSHVQADQPPPSLLARRVEPNEAERIREQFTERYRGGWRGWEVLQTTRPAAPVDGDVFVNFESGEVEIWTGTAWLPVADVSTVAKIAQQTVEEADAWPDQIKSRLEALGWDAGAPLPPGPKESEGRRLRGPRRGL